MNIICKLFGHKSLETAGWCGGVGYAECNMSEMIKEKLL